MEKTDLQKEWELRIAEFKASGLTQTKWCKVNNVTIHQFKYWFYKIERKKTSSPKSNWVSVTLDESTQDISETLKVKIGQASIEVKPALIPPFLQMWSRC